METLTKHQEESLISEDHNDNVDDDRTETKIVDYSSNNKDGETTTDNELGPSTNIEDRDVNNVSIQQDLQVELPELHKSNVDDELVNESSAENVDDNLVAENFESGNNYSEDDTTNVKVIDSLDTDVNSINPDTGSNEVDTVINGSDEYSLPPPSTSVLDTQSEQETVMLGPISSKVEDFDNKETQVFSGETLPYTFENEKSDIGFNNNLEGTIIESVDLGKISPSASIPAPSLLSPALQNLPGKVLVPAAVDQVQGQALAALQVLKVCFANYIIVFYY